MESHNFVCNKYTNFSENFTVRCDLYKSPSFLKKIKEYKIGN